MVIVSLAMKNACASFVKLGAVNSLLVWNAFQKERLFTTYPNAQDLKRRSMTNEMPLQTDQEFCSCAWKHKKPVLP
jgi:hypothetical protein